MLGVRRQRTDLNLNELTKIFFYPSHLKRLVFFLAADILIFVFSLYIAFLFHFDFSANISYSALMIEVLPYFLVLQLGFLGFFRVYRITGDCDHQLPETGDFCRHRDCPVSHLGPADFQAPLHGGVSGERDVSAGETHPDYRGRECR